MWISQGMLWVALAASGLASVGLLSEIISPKVGGVIAALPIVLALIENTMVFNARTLWYLMLGPICVGMKLGGSPLLTATSFMDSLQSPKQ
jgi:hypothetical protein